MQERCETLWPPLHSPPSVCHWPTIRSDQPKAFSDATSDDSDDEDGYDTDDRVGDDGDTDDGDDAVHQQSNPIQNFLRLGGGERNLGTRLCFPWKETISLSKRCFLQLEGIIWSFAKSLVVGWEQAIPYWWFTTLTSQKAGSRFDFHTKSWFRVSSKPLNLHLTHPPNTSGHTQIHNFRPCKSMICRPHKSWIHNQRQIAAIHRNGRRENKIFNESSRNSGLR